MVYASNAAEFCAAWRTSTEIIILSSTTYDLSVCGELRVTTAKTVRGTSSSSTVLTHATFFAYDSGRLTLEKLTVRVWAKMESWGSGELIMQDCVFAEVDIGSNFEWDWPIRIKTRSMFKTLRTRFEKNRRIAQIRDADADFQHTDFIENGIYDQLREQISFELSSVVTMKNVKFENNQGREMTPFRVSGTSQVELEDSSIIGNRVDKRPRGVGSIIQIEDQAQLTFRNCLLSGNQPGPTLLFGPSSTGALYMYNTDLIQPPPPEHPNWLPGMALEMYDSSTGKVYIQGGTAYQLCKDCRYHYTPCQQCLIHFSTDITLLP